MATLRDQFIPGTVWTPEIQRNALERMLAVLNSPEMQAMLEGAADDPNAAELGDALGLSIEISSGPGTPIDAGACTFRRAHPDDIPRMAAMMIKADLPPLFIDEWLPGFAVVEHNQELIGCGGAEIYGDSCVIRSIVIDDRARTLGLARKMTDLLVADALASGVTDAYLFTVEAHPFWLRLGWADVSLDDWKPQPRQSWQYQFISTHPDAVEGVHSMWKRIDA
jgi:N-acetylglutamate synthase-like GNAT family acetyltransferase